MLLFISFLPFIVLFSFLIFLHLSSLKAGILSVAVTLLLSLSFSIFHISFNELVYSLIKSLLISSIAAYVIFFGLFLYHLMNEQGKLSNISKQIQLLTHKQGIQLLLLLLGVSPLIESTSGFGTAFLVITPLLISLGYDKTTSALIGLISLLAVPWGALATGTVIGSEIVNIPVQQIGTISAFLSTVTISIFVIAAFYIAGKVTLVKACWKSLLTYLFLFNAANLLFNYFISTELAGVCSSLFIIFCIFLQIFVEDKKSSNILHLITSLSPYIILTVLIFFTRLIRPVKNILENTLSLQLPVYDFHLSLLYSPGFWLLITSLLIIIFYRISKQTITKSLFLSFQQWKIFVISTTCFIFLAQLMEVSSMNKIIAETIGEKFGSYYFVIAALFGSLGGYLTGSNTGANAMFMKLQVQTAIHLHISPDIIAALQNTTASNATIATPSRILLAVSICNIPEKENFIFKNLLTVLILSSTCLFITLFIWIKFN